MSQNLIALSGRSVVQVSGPDALSLLSGLLTNDIGKATADQAVFTALLTPQGKYLFDLFVLQPQPNTFLVDAPRAGDFIKRLSMYRLRSKVQIEDMASSLQVVAQIVPNQAQIEGLYEDPRLAAMGQRGIVASSVTATADGQSYEAHRLALGVPDPDKDLIAERDFLLEGLFDELNGVDFHKGCYVGQEMTSRMKRRTAVRNKLCRVRYEGHAPAFGSPIEADGREIGQMRSGVEGVGLALIRFDRARKALGQGQTLLVEGRALTLDPPDWLIEPVTSD